MFIYVSSSSAFCFVISFKIGVSFVFKRNVLTLIYTSFRLVLKAGYCIKFERKPCCHLYFVPLFRGSQIFK